jgi:hypothetical protein
MKPNRNVADKKKCCWTKSPELEKLLAKQRLKL